MERHAIAELNDAIQRRWREVGSEQPELFANLYDRQTGKLYDVHPRSPEEFDGVGSGPARRDREHRRAG